MPRVKSSPELIVRVSFRVSRPFVPVRLLERSVHCAARLLGFTRGCIGVVMTDDRGIAILNRRFMGHGRATDVLAFDLGSRSPRIIADIVVSQTTARRAALKLGISLQEELLRYVIHGLLHVAGYDDHAPAKHKKMWARQEALVRELMGSPKR